MGRKKEGGEDISPAASSSLIKNAYITSSWIRREEEKKGEPGEVIRGGKKGRHRPSRFHAVGAVRKGGPPAPNSFHQKTERERNGPQKRGQECMKKVSTIAALREQIGKKKKMTSYFIFHIIRREERKGHKKAPVEK